MTTRRRAAAGAAALVLVVGAAGGGLWSASNQLLYPSWHGATHDLAACGAELARHWGVGCGNLRVTHELAFTEVKIPSLNGYDLPGWLLGASENGAGPATGAVVLVHGGGSDRRELTRHARFYLSRRLDVLTFDLGCHGEAPCPVPGLSYGERESRDVVSAYLYLTARYDRVYAMGSSVGAAAILVALPEMPKLRGAVVENPMASFQKLIGESPEARSIPAWFTRLLVEVTMWRGRFDGLTSPERSVQFARAAPLFFIHSTRDHVVSASQTRALVDAYAGPKTVWLPDWGDHGAIRDADPAEYERRVAAFLDGAP